MTGAPLGTPKTMSVVLALQNNGNADQPAPEDVSAVYLGLSGTLIVTGRVKPYSDYDGKYDLQVFLSPSNDRPIGQGRQLVGAQTDVSLGEFGFTIDLTSQQVEGSYITLTATPATGPANTSKFSEPAAIVVA